MSTTLEQVSEEGQGAGTASPPTQRVIAVVELLAHAPGRGWSLVEICTRLRLSRATGHAIMTALSAGEWVTRDEALRYRIGPALPALFAGSMLERDFRGPLRELSARLGMPVFLTEHCAENLIVRVVTTGDGAAPSAITEGLSLPFVVPFGREFVAWDAAAQVGWLSPAGRIPKAQTDRIKLTLNYIRDRGFCVERLSGAYLRIFRAMQALGADSGHDEISTRLAAAFLELTTIDLTDEELRADAVHAIATISAPISDAEHRVRLSVSAQPMGPLDGEHVRRIGDSLRTFAATYRHLAPPPAARG
ncbi:helix-turn-helix domain-containing protein [Nocardia suismassiliense]|uniref:helix-turn-helix domain-containing protein n=1 Tax=Nocardia suismassiliense TaxID=2077092 RepID=UPI00131EF322|nr:helix-turn-helix domain-containing protein [Nocardia suismassiliense]